MPCQPAVESSPLPAPHDAQRCVTHIDLPMSPDCPSHKHPALSSCLRPHATAGHLDAPFCLRVLAVVPQPSIERVPLCLLRDR
eukprot:scaffold60817_cov30-Tisochrysis_lutea.AAC.1